MYYTIYRFLMANSWVEVPTNSFIGFDIEIIYISSFFFAIIIGSNFFIAINIDIKIYLKIDCNKICPVPDLHS